MSCKELSYAFGANPGVEMEAETTQPVFVPFKVRQRRLSGCKGLEALAVPVAVPIRVYMWPVAEFNQFYGEDFEAICAVAPIERGQSEKGQPLLIISDFGAVREDIKSLGDTDFIVCPARSMGGRDSRFGGLRVCGCAG